MKTSLDRETVSNLKSTIWHFFIWENIQMQLMWLCVCTWKEFEETSEHTLQKRRTNATSAGTLLLMLKFWRIIYEGAQWRKVIQMQSMWVCICLDWQSAETFENSLRGDSSQPMHYVSIPILPLLPIIPLVHLHPSSNTPCLIPFHWSLPLVHIYITLAHQHWYYTFCSNFTLTNNTNALEHTLTLAFLHIY